MTLVGSEQLAACIEQTMLTPTSGGNLFDDEYVQPARPCPLHTHCINPRDGVKRAMDRSKVDTEEPGAAHSLFDNSLHVDGRHVLEATGHRDSLDRLVQTPQHHCDGRANPERPTHRNAQR